MSDAPQLDKWDPPVWHPDFGDAVKEFIELRKLAEELVSKKLVVLVKLETPEPGLMFLHVSTGNGKPAQVYSVPVDGDEVCRRYAVFISPDSPDEIEVYCDSVDKAVDLLQTGAD